MCECAEVRHTVLGGLEMGRACGGMLNALGDVPKGQAATEAYQHVHHTPPADRSAILTREAAIQSSLMATIR